MTDNRLRTKKDLLDLGIWIENDKYRLGLMPGCIATMYPVSISDNRTRGLSLREVNPHMTYNRSGLRKMYMIYKFHGGKITISAARLYYIWFIGDVKDGFDVDHIDNDSLNNSVENLQLISHQENIKKKVFDTQCRHANECWLRNLDLKTFKAYCKKFSNNV